MKITRSHGGNVAGIAKKHALNKENILDFSANINYLGPPKGVVEALKNNFIDLLTNYPEKDLKDTLKGKISEHYRIEKEKIFLGNGASEIFFLLARIIKPKNVLIPAPTFIEYYYAVNSMEAKVDILPLSPTKGFRLELADIIKSYQKKNFDMLFVCNPNNPTGILVERKEMSEIIEWTRSNNITLIIDEAFMDFLPGQKECTSLGDASSNTIIVRSMTKFFAIPGLRLGFSVSSPQYVEAMELGSDPWNVNGLATMAGIEALQDEEYHQLTIEKNTVAREALYQELNSINRIKVYPSATNYLFFKLVDEQKSVVKDLMGELLEKNIYIRDCSSFPFLDQGYYRISINHPQENQELIRALKKILEV